MDPRCHKGHFTPSARLCLLHQCLEWGNKWEMRVGDRDGSAGIDLQHSSNPRCSKGKDFLREKSQIQKAEGSSQADPARVRTGEKEVKTQHINLRICCNLTISIHHINSLQLLTGHLCPSSRLKIERRCCCI